MNSRLTLRAENVDVAVDPAAGGRIASLRVDGLDLLVSEGTGPLLWGCYPMVPWAGRLREGILRWRGGEHRLPAAVLPPHAIHGTLLQTAWEVVDAGSDAATLAAELAAPWPFGGRAIHRVTLTPAGLRAELEVHAGDHPMPAIAGWHPWFPRVLRNSDGAVVGEPVVVDLDAGGMLRRGADGLPDGTVIRPIPPEPWDDCFIDVAGAAGVHWPGALEVRIVSDVPCWVVYTEHATGVCVEPQTGPPDGLNTDEHTVVEPGAPLVTAMTISWRRLG